MARIAVIGTGPAGLAFASAMSGSEHDIVLFERAAQTRAVGSGFVLQPTGLAIATMLGIRNGVEQLGHRIDRVTGLTTGTGRVVIDVDYSLLASTPYALGLHRASLFNSLVGLVLNSHCPIITSCNIKEYRSLADGEVELKDSAGDLIGPFDLVVDASGLSSALRAQAFGKHTSTKLRYGSLWAMLDAPEGLFEDHVLHQRFASSDSSIGIMPIGCEKLGESQQLAMFWNIDTAGYNAVKAGGLNSWKRKVIAIWPECAVLLDQIESFEQLNLAIYRHHTSTPLSKQGIVFIGDAAHSTNPLLGQGVNMALVDAVTLAQALRGAECLKTACALYAQRRRLHIRVIQTLARSLIPFYKSDYDTLTSLRNLLFHPLSKLPYMDKFIALMVSGLITNPLEHFHHNASNIGSIKPSSGATGSDFSTVHSRITAEL